MSILVTGGAGYIGSHVVHELADRGERVVVLDNLSTGFREALPAGIRLVVGDTGDEKAVRELIRRHDVEAIIHFAASIVVPESVAKPLTYYRNNTANSRSLIEAAVAGRVSYFLFSSTAAVYGNPERVPVTEDAPLAPMSPYGSSKLMTEIMLRDAAAAHGFKYTVLRYFNVAGADPRLRTGQSTKGATHLIKVAVETALGQRPELSVFGTDYPTGDGTCVRDYIHVTDLARAHLAALDRLRGGGENRTLNCGYGRGYSVLDVIKAVESEARTRLPLRMAARRPGDPALIVAACDRIKEELAWKPNYDDLHTIVRHALEWERKVAETGSNPAEIGDVRRAAKAGG